MKKLLVFIIAAVMILSVIPVVTLSSAAAQAPAIVKDGLVAWYDGANNTNGEQDYDTTVWRDLSGNGNHMSVKVDDTNKWTDNAYHVDASTSYFPSAVKDVINGDEYTFEFVAGELSYAATHWITLMCSDNDEFSLFVRVGSETNLEYKYNDKNTDRPMADNGAELINNSTVTVTFDLSEQICIVYVNGVAVDSGVPTVANIADTLSFGHESTERAWSGDIHAFRFYNRVLSEDEVMDNAKADNKKYRSGDYYPPEQEYDDAGEEIAGGLEGDFRNDLIPLLPELDLIPPDGFYGTESIIDNFYAYEGDEKTWPGVRLIATDEPETNTESGTEYTPVFYVNYQKYCRLTGLTRMNGEDVTYIVLKIKVEDGYFDDLHMWAMAGDTHNSWSAFHTGSYYGGAECTGETEYLIYDLVDAWDGPINMLRFELRGLEPGVAVYIDEIAFFGTEEEAFIYAGEIEPEETTSDETDAEETNEETTAEEATDPETTAPETDTQSAKEETTAADEESGCGAAVGFGAVAILSASAAAVALRKKD